MKKNVQTPVWHVATCVHTCHTFAVICAETSGDATKQTKIYCHYQYVKNYNKK